LKPPPARIETERLLLRTYEERDIPAFTELLESSREHYRFISFFYDDDPADRVRRSREQFLSGESFPYVAFAGDRLIGGCGLLPRIGPGALEIGYHVGAGATGRGYATEMTATLIDVAFDVCGVDRIELHIDPENTPSIRVAERLGVPFERMSDVAVYTLTRELRERA
jgi:RimJ/RimL family protein N-acetyltransferase